MVGDIGVCVSFEKKEKREDNAETQRAQRKRGEGRKERPASEGGPYAVTGRRGTQEGGLKPPLRETEKTKSTG